MQIPGAHDTNLTSPDAAAPPSPTTNNSDHVDQNQTSSIVSLVASVYPINDNNPDSTSSVGLQNSRSTDDPEPHTEPVGATGTTQLPIDANAQILPSAAENVDSDDASVPVHVVQTTRVELENQDSAESGIGEAGGLSAQAAPSGPFIGPTKQTIPVVHIGVVLLFCMLLLSYSFLV